MVAGHDPPSNACCLCVVTAVCFKCTDHFFREVNEIKDDEWNSGCFSLDLVFLDKLDSFTSSFLIFDRSKEFFELIWRPLCDKLIGKCLNKFLSS